MNSSTVPIEPSTEITTRVITSFTVNVMRLELFQSVTVNAMLYGADGNFIEVKTLTLSGQDYLDWNNNDKYLINKVAEKLGFTIAPTPPVPEPVVPNSVVPTLLVVPNSVVPNSVVPNSVVPTPEPVTEPVVPTPEPVTEPTPEPVTEPTV